MMPLAKYFLKDLVWVAKCMIILFEFFKNFKICNILFVVKMAKNQKIPAVLYINSTKGVAYIY